MITALEHTVVSDSAEGVSVDLELVSEEVVGGSEEEEIVVTEVCKVSVSVTVCTSRGELVEDTGAMATVVVWIPKPLSDDSSTSDLVKHTT